MISTSSKWGGCLMQNIDEYMLSKQIGDIREQHGFIEGKLSMLETLINNMISERAMYLDRRARLVQEIERRRIASRPISLVPFQAVLDFLTECDACSLASTCWTLRNSCSCEKKKLTVKHVSEFSMLLSYREAQSFVNTVNLGCIESINFVETKTKSPKLILQALVALHKRNSSAATFHSLKKLYINIGAKADDLQSDVFYFIENCLSKDQLTDLRLSGFSSIAATSRIASAQANSLKSFSADYFVRGHEKSIPSEVFPLMPNADTIVFDVADDTEMDVKILLDRLSKHNDIGSITRLYMPHVRLTGDSESIVMLVDEIKKLKSAKQIVIQFTHLPMSIGEAIKLRMSEDSGLGRFPAVCIAYHFIVAQQDWADWWTPMDKLWVSRDDVNGLNVFREQIDFQSFDTTAVREWLLMSDEDKDLWDNKFAKKVLSLYDRAANEAAAALAAIETLAAAAAASAVSNTTITTTSSSNGIRISAASACRSNSRTTTASVSTHESLSSSTSSSSTAHPMLISVDDDGGSNDGDLDYNDDYNDEEDDEEDVVENENDDNVLREGRGRNNNRDDNDDDDFGLPESSASLRRVYLA